MRACEIARTWGVSPGYVSRLIKKGMPTGSLAEADSWRLANLQKPPRSQSGAAVVKIAAGTGQGMKLCEVGDESPGARLKRANEAERLAFHLLRELAEGGNAIALRSGVHAFGEAQRRCSEAELNLAKHQLATGELISTAEVREVFTNTLGVIRSLMDALPAALAVRANPSDPECAKRALQEGVDQILRAVSKSEQDDPFPTPAAVFGVLPLPATQSDS